jgi:hypothetical protein
MFGWVVSMLFGIAEDVLLWIFPLYITVTVLRDRDQAHYKGLMCFWALVATLYGLESITFYLLNRIMLYRVVRFAGILYLQYDYGRNAAILMQHKLEPYIDPNEKAIEEGIESVLNVVRDRTSEYLPRLQAKFSEGVLSFGPDILKSALAFANKGDSKKPQAEKAVKSPKADETDDLDSVLKQNDVSEDMKDAAEQ